PKDGQQTVISDLPPNFPSMAYNPPAKAKSVTHVSGTLCYLCLRSVIGGQYGAFSAAAEPALDKDHLAQRAKLGSNPAAPASVSLDL
ncbi:MAG: hypothetical protein AAGA36_11230, partial [Pseudomonadota bacterium]